MGIGMNEALWKGLTSLRPLMALFRNFGVNRRNRLCGIQKYASAQFLDFLELAENCAFLDRKLPVPFLKPRMDTNYIPVYLP